MIELLLARLEVEQFIYVADVVWTSDHLMIEREIAAQMLSIMRDIEYEPISVDECDEHEGNEHQLRGCTGADGAATSGLHNGIQRGRCNFGIATVFRTLLSLSVFC